MIDALANDLVFGVNFDNRYWRSRKWFMSDCKRLLKIWKIVLHSTLLQLSLNPSTGIFHKNNMSDQSLTTCLIFIIYYLIFISAEVLNRWTLPYLLNKQMKHVLIIGASGNIATKVTDMLLNKRQVQLTLFVRNRKRLSSEAVAACKVIEGSAMDYDALVTQWKDRIKCTSI